MDGYSLSAIGQWLDTMHRNGSKEFRDEALGTLREASPPLTREEKEAIWAYLGAVYPGVVEWLKNAKNSQV